MSSDGNDSFDRLDPGEFKSACGHGNHAMPLGCWRDAVLRRGS
jgi:hypothetical protein